MKKAIHGKAATKGVKLRQAAETSDSVDDCYICLQLWEHIQGIKEKKKVTISSYARY